MDKYLGKKTKNASMVKKELTMSQNTYKKPYPPSIIVREIPVAGQIRAQLLTNSLGKFIDLRYFSGNTPTKRGIRIHLRSFLDAIVKLKEDMVNLADTDDD